MMRRILITLIVCFYILPTFAYTVDITTLGAKGDGITDNTAFIQKAIDDCSARKGGNRRNSIRAFFNQNPLFKIKCEPALTFWSRTFR